MVSCSVGCGQFAVVSGQSLVSHASPPSLRIPTAPPLFTIVVLTSTDRKEKCVVYARGGRMTEETKRGRPDKWVEWIGSAGHQRSTDPEKNQSHLRQQSPGTRRRRVPRF